MAKQKVQTTSRKRGPERNTFLADVLVTAVEGGINYWSYVVSYAWWTPEDQLGTSGPEGDALGSAPGGGNNAFVILEDKEDHQSYRVTLDTVARGIRQILTGETNVATRIEDALRDADRHNDAGGVNHYGIDSEVADCVVQVALFGEVIYG